MYSKIYEIRALKLYITVYGHLLDRHRDDPHLVEFCKEKIKRAAKQIKDLKGTKNA